MSIARNIPLMAWHNFFTELRPFTALAAVYFADVAGSYTEGMMVFSVIMLSSLLFEVPTGILSDKIGRKATLFLGSITYAVSMLCYALAGDLTLLLLGAAIGGLSDALVSGNNNALVYETLNQSGRKDTFRDVWGKLGSVFQISLGVAAMLGGLALYLDVPLRALVWVSFGSQIVCMVLSLFLIEPEKHTEKTTNIYNDLKEAFQLFTSNRKLRLVTVANAIQSGIGEASHGFSPAFFGTVWPLWAVNGLSVIRNVLGAAGYWIAGWVCRKYGEVITLLAGSSLMTGIGIVAALLQNAASPLLTFLNNLFYGINDVAKEHLLQQEFDARQRATMGSLAQFLQSCVGAVAALFLGVMADATGPAMAFLCAMILRIPAIWLYWSVFRREPPRVIKH
jgi:MFS family permease